MPRYSRHGWQHKRQPERLFFTVLLIVLAVIAVIVLLT